MNNNKERFSRTELLFGTEAMERLTQKRVIIFGIGGVGGYVAEVLARSGIGTLDLVDSDTVCMSNINRQIIATEKTVGMPKVYAAKERLQDINPSLVINTFNTFFLPETAHLFNFADYDYVVDAVDTVKAKIEIIMQAQAAGVPVISSMGAGNKVDPTAFKVADIYSTKVCPLAKVMRTELKKRHVKKLKVVYSEESPVLPAAGVIPSDAGVRRSVPGSNAFTPSVAGIIAASEVIKDLAALQVKHKGS